MTTPLLRTDPRVLRRWTRVVAILALTLSVTYWFGLESVVPESNGTARDGHGSSAAMARDSAGAEASRTTSDEVRLERVSLGESPPVVTEIAEIEVRVLDEGRVAVPGVPVVAARVGDSSSTVSAPQVITDREGRARFRMETTELRFVANAAGPVRPEYGSAEVRVDFRVAVAAPVTITLIRAVIGIDVTVRDDLGAPVAGVEVQGNVNRITDSAGQARLDGFVPGELRVALGAGPIGPGMAYSCDSGEWRGERRTPGRERVEFTLIRNGILEIAVPEAVGAQAFVSEIHAAAATRRSGARFTRSGVSGETVVIAGVPAGEYRIDVTFAADASLLCDGVETVRVSPGETTRAVLTVREAPHVFRGRVLDVAGNPRRGVVVNVSDLEGAAIRGFVLRKSAVTDDAGRFEIRGLPATLLRGGLDVESAAGDSLAYVGSFERPYFDVRANDAPIELRVEPGCAIRGLVTRTATEAPDRIDVTIDRLQSKFDAVKEARRIPDRNGRACYEFEFTHLRRGTYRLCAGSGFARPFGPVREVTVAPEAEATRSVVVELECTSKHE